MQLSRNDFIIVRVTVGSIMASLRSNISKPNSVLHFPLPTSARKGWLIALEYCLRLKEFGLFFAGLPCCSFIWLNRSTSMRSQHTPFGDQLKIYVQEANLQLVFKWLPWKRIQVTMIYIWHMTLKFLGWPIQLSKLICLKFKKPRLATRTLMMCALCLVRCCHFEIEQPGSSTFVYYPYLVWMQQLLKQFVPVEVHRLWGSQIGFGKNLNDSHDTPYLCCG